MPRLTEDDVKLAVSAHVEVVDAVVEAQDCATGQCSQPKASLLSNACPNKKISRGTETAVLAMG